MGNDIVMILPSPSVLWKSALPPCSSTTLFVMASPRPRPVLFVEKKGSNSFSIFSFETPDAGVFNNYIRFPVGCLREHCQVAACRHRLKSIQDNIKDACFDQFRVHREFWNIAVL